MQLHPAIGARILSGSTNELLMMAERIALTHHERWDGRGYPSGLAGEAIPLPGRIVSVADVFDALTHRRPYKEAWPVPAAVSEILGETGTKFDPRVIEAFGKLDHAGLVQPVKSGSQAVVVVEDDLRLGRGQGAHADVDTDAAAA